MKRLTILTLGAAASIVACSDSGNLATGPIDQSPPRTEPSLATIAGRITVTNYGDALLIELQDEGGTKYRLVGSQAGALASIDGGDVVARGTFDANPGFVVEDFQVTGMQGRPALDGVLEATIDGYALRLQDGTLHAFSTSLVGLDEHVGARLWVIGFEGDVGVKVGVITAAESTFSAVRLDHKRK